jgi:hypothetical protein
MIEAAALQIRLTIEHFGANDDTFLVIKLGTDTVDGFVAFSQARLPLTEFQNPEPRSRERYYLLREFSRE